MTVANGPWTDNPSVSGRYLCLKDGEFRLYDVSYYRDLQMGISGQWEAAEVCSGTRRGWMVENLQPAKWLLVADLLLPEKSNDQ